MQNAWLDKSQAGIKIAGRNVNNLRYGDDITLMAESRRTKDPLNEGKEESEKGGLKLSIQNTKIMASSPITSNRWGNNDRLHFLGLENHYRQ